MQWQSNEVIENEIILSTTSFKSLLKTTTNILLWCNYQQVAVLLRDHGVPLPLADIS